MRLLHTTTFTLHPFAGPRHDAPQYAILSHTWDKHEVLFEDMATPEAMVAAASQKPKAWAKVMRSCDMARALGFEYLWIDTLCIEKSSSAELSEAINSMFDWYALSGVCLAYISDYKDDGLKAGTSDASKFLSSRWFTRGWTLQELIAPANLVFYDKDWFPIGDRRFLANFISSKTFIYRKILARRVPVQADNLQQLRRDLTAVCVAAKMKWVSMRQTGRPEDIAYCMLGLFNVNMPLLYGEGAQKAFLRLQEEIIKHSFDQTILAWQSPIRDPLLEGRWDWILAPSADYFAESHSVQLLRGQPRFHGGGSHPEGLNFEAVICTVEPLESSRSARFPFVAAPDNAMTEAGKTALFLAILHCCADGNFTKRIALLLYRDRDTQDRYYRAHTAFFVIEFGDRNIEIDTRARRQDIHLDGAKSQQIMLCSPPTQSWHSKQGYWPCGINWKSVWTDWQLVDYLECKTSPEGPLSPRMPSWSPNGENLELSSCVHPRRYKINGILLFERADQDAFFVIWGSAPSTSEEVESTPRPWWRGAGGYFCTVVEWEVFTEMPYNRGDLAWLVGEWHHQTSTFYPDLVRFCSVLMTGERLTAECHQTVGARHQSSTVSASVSEQTFLGVEGLVVGVFIE